MELLHALLDKRRIMITVRIFSVSTLACSAIYSQLFTYGLIQIIQVGTPV